MAKKIELKTKPTRQSVQEFLATIPDPARRADSQAVYKIMNEVTGDPGTMWGSSMVGFGTVVYTRSTGEELDWMAIGFAPRKQNLTLYLMGGFDRYPNLMKNLGKYSTGVGCLYLKRLSDANPTVLRELIAKSYAYFQEEWPKK